MGKDNRISTGEKLLYGLGDIGANLVWSSTAAFLTYYYTNVISMSAAVAGTILLLSRIIDSFSDILMGNIIDKTHSKYGKARPWLLWAAGPFALSIFLMYAVPTDWSNTGKVIYAFISYNFMCTVCYTAITLPQSALGALITENQKDRTLLSIYRMVAAMLAGLAAQMCVLPLARLFGQGDVLSTKGWMLTFLMFGVIAGLLFLLEFFGIRERVVDNTPKEKRMGSIKVLKALFKNQYWVILLIAGILSQLLLGTMGIHPYFAQYWLGNVDLAGLLSLALLLPALISVIISNFMFIKFGKRNSIMFGLIVYLVGAVIQLINPHSFIIIAVGAAIRGLGMGPASAGMYVMLAEVSDYHELITGSRSEGMVYSAASFGNKVGAGLGAAIIGWMLALGKYDAALEVQGTPALTSIMTVYVYIPIIIAVLLIVLYAKYGLDKEYPQILKELNEKRSSSQSI